MSSHNTIPDLNRSVQNLSLNRQNSSQSSSNSSMTNVTSNEQSPKYHTPPSQTQSHTPTSPLVTPSIGHSHTQLNSDIQARIMAFQQKRANKTPSNNSGSINSNSITVSSSMPGGSTSASLKTSLDEETNKSDSTIMGLDRQSLQSNHISPIPPLPSQQVRSKSSNDAHGDVETTADKTFHIPLSENGSPSFNSSSNGSSLPPSTGSSASNSSVNLNEDSNHPSLSKHSSQHNSKPELTSLSQRRGKLQLNINDISSTGSPGTLSPPVAFPGDVASNQVGMHSTPANLLNTVKPPSAAPNKPLIGSTGELSRRISERKRKPNFKLNLNDDPNLMLTSPKVEGEQGNDPNDKNNEMSTSRIMSPQSGSPSSQIESPGQSQPKLQGLFANYSKYIDIKSGSLNFTGKASLNSTGIDFSSGTSFRISLDQLQFIDELGRGNYGTVSKVLHKPTGVLMAMKEVRLELDESKFTQILMELDVLHKCQSPYIVDFYGAFFVEGAVYMCIEYMDGGSADKVYEKDEGIKDESHLAYITESVIRGLKELKDNHNIIHRDVKPTNILINSKGKVKLCDFGVSGNLVSSLAKTNIGCQSYMAPERIKSLNPDDSTYSVQSDIWSLGLTILEIAKGNYPYPAETYDNIFSQLSAMVDGEPPKLDPKLFSKEARMFVKSCLNKNPDLRPSYQTLLNHPWLVRHRGQPIDSFEHYVKDRINQIQLDNKLHKSVPKPKENVSSILKGKVRAPALHRGGLFNNNRNFMHRQ